LEKKMESFKVEKDGKTESGFRNQLLEFLNISAKIRFVSIICKTDLVYKKYIQKYWGVTNDDLKTLEEMGARWGEHKKVAPDLSTIGEWLKKEGALLDLSKYTDSEINQMFIKRLTKSFGKSE